MRTLPGTRQLSISRRSIRAWIDRSKCHTKRNQRAWSVPVLLYDLDAKLGRLETLSGRRRSRSRRQRWPGDRLQKPLFLRLRRWTNGSMKRCASCRRQRCLRSSVGTRRSEGGSGLGRMVLGGDQRENAVRDIDYELVSDIETPQANPGGLNTHLHCLAATRVQ